MDIKTIFIEFMPRALKRKFNFLFTQYLNTNNYIYNLKLTDFKIMI